MTGLARGGDGLRGFRKRELLVVLPHPKFPTRWESRPNSDGCLGCTGGEEAPKPLKEAFLNPTLP